MDLGINDKRVLVTGSTAGIGFATAAVLAREGAKSSSTVARRLAFRRLSSS